jgi:predicted site-specific integrase-resolvase
MRKNDTVESRKVAEALGIDNSTMSRWITTGRFKAVEKIGRSWHFRTADLIAAIEKIPAEKETLPLLDEQEKKAREEEAQAKRLRKKEMITKKIATAIDEVYGEETL